MFKSLFQGNYISGGTFNVHVSTSASTSTMVNESPQRKKFRRLRVLDSQEIKVVKDLSGFVLKTDNCHFLSEKLHPLFVCFFLFLE